MADQGGFSDNEILSATQPRASKSANAGFADLGSALAGGIQQNGSVAYTKGMQIGAQTADALAQARSRVQEAQGRETAAQSLENPQTQQALGLKPEEATLMAARTRAGDSFENLAAATKSFQDARLHGTVADTTADPNARRAAALSLAPASGAIHAEGANGTFVDPFSSNYTSDQPGGPDNTPVTVGAQQTALNNSEIALRKKQGDAALQNADAHQTQAEKPAANAGLPQKLQTGYQFKLNDDKTSPDFGKPVLDATGNPVQEPKTGANAPEGAVNKRYNQNMLGGALGAAQELENAAAIGPTTTAGATSFDTGHGGILATLSNNLGRAASSTDQQEYHKTMTNIGRYVGLVENGGRPPPGGVTGPIQSALESQPGDTEYSRLYGLASARQALEVQQDRINASGTTQDVKDAYDKAIKKAQAAIPYTPKDIIDFGRAPQGTKLNDFLNSRHSSGGSVSTADPEGNAPPPGFKVVN